MSNTNNFEKGIKDANLARFNNINQIKIGGIEQTVVNNFEKGLINELEFGAAFEEIDILKGGKRAVIGEQRMFAGRLHVKTADGWKFVGKGTGQKAKSHVEVHTSKSDSDDDGTHTETKELGSKLWKNEKGEYYREGDKPARIDFDGSKRYYKNGKLHRDNDLPAFEYANGRKEWYQNGKLHRAGDKPAIITAAGEKIYVKNGKLHRDGDQPAGIHADGTQEFWKNDKRHRDGGKPAIIKLDGTKEYWENGKHIRTEKPGEKLSPEDLKMTKEISEYFKDYGVEMTDKFSLSDFAEATGNTKEESRVLLSNLEDGDLMKEIASGDYDNFDKHDSSQFNDSYHDMMADLGYGDNDEEDDDDEYEEKQQEAPKKEKRFVPVSDDDFEAKHDILDAITQIGGHVYTNGDITTWYLQSQ